MQTAAYFAPETLIPAQYIPSMLSGQTGSRQNCLIVAEDDEGRVLGGALFHYLAEAGSGFSSFLGVDQAHRHQGIARCMRSAFACLTGQRAAGSQGYSSTWSTPRA